MILSIAIAALVLALAAYGKAGRARAEFKEARAIMHAGQERNTEQLNSMLWRAHDAGVAVEVNDRRQSRGRPDALN